ncbi:Guanine deaminase [Eumeta japonica]|uniref:Guanine deaminase n=1 Tax=Eumeta variegata TaxID=151549 RepID=A0A4C1UL01_EUMVA|nr:Guanine deaminase [Eumeta japonica]
MSKLIFVGNFVSPVSLDDLKIANGYICVENGIVTNLGLKSDLENFMKNTDLRDFTVKRLTKDQLLMPGLIDCHVHAPQFPNIGLGLDRPLLEWLDTYTFPLEKQYSNEKFAAEIYDQVVKRLLKNGTTTACYFGSLDLNGTLELARKVVKYNQRAFVGKVSMNIPNDAGYYNNTDKEAAEVESFIQEIMALKNDLIEPIVTPRFAVSCDEKLLTKLAVLAEKYNCMIQSHISENLGEIEFVKQINPEALNYADVYDRSKILRKKVHLSDTETKMLAARGVSVAHCPASNTRLRSGLCPLRRLLDAGLTVGLGTDVSGGDSATILDAIRRAMDVSTHLEIKGHEGAAITWKEGLYLATLGGAKDHRIGNFDKGKEFDAILVDVYENSGPIDKYSYSIDRTDDEYIESLLQRFIYLGDDRNIIEVYVKGAERYPEQMYNGPLTSRTGRACRLVCAILNRFNIMKNDNFLCEVYEKMHLEKIKTKIKEFQVSVRSHHTLTMAAVGLGGECAGPHSQARSSGHLTRLESERDLRVVEARVSGAVCAQRADADADANAPGPTTRAPTLTT